MPDEHADADLAALRGWAEAASPIRIYPNGAAPVADIVDLSAIAGGEDPANLPRLLAGARAATGGALSTDDGMTAAIAAGVEIITGSPTLPLLLAAARAGRGTDRKTPAASASS